MKLRWPMLCLLLALTPAQGAELGRLFFTPAQRAALDNARKQNIRIEVGSDAEQPAAPVPQNISVNGLVQRSDGKSTVWLNHRAITEQQKTGGGFDIAPGRKDHRVKLTVPESGRSVEVKVGQTVEVVSGTIEEGYARRSPPPTPIKPAAEAETKVPAGSDVAPVRRSRTGRNGRQFESRPDAGSDSAQ